MIAPSLYRGPTSILFAPLYNRGTTRIEVAHLCNKGATKIEVAPIHYIYDANLITEVAPVQLPLELHLYITEAQL